MKTRRRALLVASTLGVVLLAAGLVDAKLVRTGEAAVAAHIKATAGINFDARTTDLRVSESADGIITLVVPLATLQTGIGRRDKDMKDKLQVDRFPAAELKVQRAALKFPDDGKEVGASAPATLSLHGQTRPVTIGYKARRAGSSYSVQGSTAIDMRDFGIEPPTRLGLKVQPQVAIAVRFQLTD